MHILEVFSAFDPDPEMLLRAVSQYITDEMLNEIAKADYGDDQEKHFESLVPLRDSGIFPAEMVLYPGEVLELIRYSKPDHRGWKPGSTGFYGHWMRAFSSAALLRALGEPWNYRGDAAQPSYSLIQLILSLSALPVDLNREAAQFLAWFLLQPDLGQRDEQGCYFGIGLLWFALQGPRLPSDEILASLAQWIIQREEEVRRQGRRNFDRWLLGVGRRNPPPSPWELLGVELCEFDFSHYSPEVSDWVKLIGSHLAG
jgi:hypothetical protein